MEGQRVVLHLSISLTGTQSGFRWWESPAGWCVGCPPFCRGLREAWKSQTRRKPARWVEKGKSLESLLNFWSATEAWRDLPPAGPWGPPAGAPSARRSSGVYNPTPWTIPCKPRRRSRKTGLWAWTAGPRGPSDGPAGRAEEDSGVETHNSWGEIRHLTWLSYLEPFPVTLVYATAVSFLRETELNWCQDFGLWLVLFCNMSRTWAAEQIELCRVINEAADFSAHLKLSTKMLMLS